MTRRCTVLCNIGMGCVLILFAVLCQPVLAKTMCCNRDLAVTPIEMPEGETVAEGWCTWGTIWVGVLQGCICDARNSEPECPIGLSCINLGAMVDFNKWLDAYTQAAYGIKPDAQELKSRERLETLDYLFIANVTCSDPTVLHQTEEDPTGGDTLVETTVLFGHWAVNVQVVDHFHGNVLEEFDIEWIGRAGDFVQPEHYRYGKSYTNSIRRAFEEYFVPLGKMIYDYERTPDTCTMKPPKDSVELGEKIEIRAEGFVDSLQRPSAKFQRVLVEAQNGEILNGVEASYGRAFVVGEDCVINIEYRAPENCDAETDTIIIKNSCYFNKPLKDVLPGVEICRQALKVYDRLPKRCDINPEKPSVEAGTSINVDITNVVDNMGKPMKPEERLMVKAGTGKITNGMSHGEYRIFEVGDGTIHARYKAENDCQIIADTIEVYSCCIEGEDIPQFVPQELIRQKKVNIKCEYEWIGSLTFNQSSDFGCDIDSTDEPNTTYLRAAESGKQLGALDVVTNKIDIERRGTAMLTSSKMEASGYVNCSRNIDREKGSSSSERGDWTKEKNTMTASRHCQLTESNLKISMSKDVTGVESTVDQLAKEMLAAAKAGDVKRAEEIKIKMKEAVHGGSKDVNRLSIQVQIGIDCVAPAQKTHTFQQYDGTEDEMVKNIDDKSTEEVRIGTPIVLTMDGTFTKGKDDRQTITGTYSKSGPKESGMGLGNIKCQPISTSVSCNLTLTRRRK